ncbi:hypothetical protein MMC26_005263 [Xylographa opegraphella]|nr:hypothetical protein [Xylographa opegraphella]
MASLSPAGAATSTEQTTSTTSTSTTVLTITLYGSHTASSPTAPLQTVSLPSVIIIGPTNASTTLMATAASTVQIMPVPVTVSPSSNNAAVPASSTIVIPVPPVGTKLSSAGAAVASSTTSAPGMQFTGATLFPGAASSVHSSVVGLLAAVGAAIVLML